MAIRKFRLLKRAPLGVPAALAAMLVAGAAAAANGDAVGTVTGQPVPRYASLKHDKVSLREGPSKEHRTAWIFQRAGLPVEITAEFDTWRRVRDSEGSEGWVQQVQLSNLRTSLVAPGKKADALMLYAKPDTGSDVVARIQPGVIGIVKMCNAGWCRILDKDKRFDGYIQQPSLWGVYPNEKF